MSSQNMIDKRNLYFYIYSFSKALDLDETDYGFIEAKDEKDCYLKVFEELPDHRVSFIYQYKKHDIIKKYIDKWEEQYGKGIHKVATQKLVFEEEDMEHINELKYDYIECVRASCLLMIVKYPNQAL